MFLFHLTKEDRQKIHQILKQYQEITLALREVIFDYTGTPVKVALLETLVNQPERYISSTAARMSALTLNRSAIAPVLA